LISIIDKADLAPELRPLKELEGGEGFEEYLDTVHGSARVVYIKVWSVTNSVVIWLKGMPNKEHAFVRRIVLSKEG